MIQDFLQRLRYLQEQLKQNPSKTLLVAIEEELKQLMAHLKDLERLGGYSNGKSNGKFDEEDRTSTK